MNKSIGKGLASIGVCCLGVGSMYFLDDLKILGLIFPILGVIVIWNS